jgi:hypothetical protein
MTATLDEVVTDPQKTIAELRRQLDERTAERDEALAPPSATKRSHSRPRPPRSCR